MFAGRSNYTDELETIVLNAFGEPSDLLVEQDNSSIPAIVSYATNNSNVYLPDSDFLDKLPVFSNDTARSFEKL